MVFRRSAHAHDARGRRIQRPRHERDRKSGQDHQHHGPVGPNETPGIPALRLASTASPQPRSLQRRGTRDGASDPATSHCYPCCPRVRNIISRVPAGPILAYDSRSFRCFSCRGWAARRRPRGGLFEWVGSSANVRRAGTQPCAAQPTSERAIALCARHADPRWFTGAQRAFSAMVQGVPSKKSGHAASCDGRQQRVDSGLATRGLRSCPTGVSSARAHACVGHGSASVPFRVNPGTIRDAFGCRSCRSGHACGNAPAPARIQ